MSQPFASNPAGSSTLLDAAEKLYLAVPKSINKNHCFTVHHTDPITLLTAEHNGDTEQRQRVLNSWIEIDPNDERDKTRCQLFTINQVNRLQEEAPGMKDIKWVELRTNGRSMPPLHIKIAFAQFHLTK